MAVARPPHPISNPPAPPSPPSPTLSHVSTLALFAAEMYAWLWFRPSEASGAKGEGGKARDGAVSKLQVQPTERFVRFCHEVLTTTQVSHSVVLLSLLLLDRLKGKNAINGAAGSEFRLAVTSLMLANKVLDDNTYTAQTWSQVSSLELKPLVAGEAEFLKGLEWQLHITERDFNAWLKLLEGHVAARNLRLGKVTPTSAGLIPSSRKIASSKRVRAAAAREELHGLGIEGGSLLPAPQSEGDAVAEGRRVRPRISVSASTNTTPTSSFATFTLPAPASVPHAQPYSSAPLPAYANQPSSSHSATSPFPPLDVSPTSVAHTARRTAALRAASASSASSSGTKRRAEEAFDARPPTAIPAFLAPQSSGMMARSYSAGPATAPGPQGGLAAPSYPANPYIQPAHQAPPPALYPLNLATSPAGSRPSSSSSTASAHYAPSFPYPPQPHLQAGPQGFQTLVGSFSPRYDADHHRRMQQGDVSLGYYSLAAGQTLGHLRQTLAAPQAYPPPHPQPYAPHHPSGLSTVSTSPVSEAYAHGFAQQPGACPPRYAPQQHAYPTPALSSFGAVFPAPGGAAMAPSSSSHGYPSSFPEATRQPYFCADVSPTSSGPAFPLQPFYYAAPYAPAQAPPPHQPQGPNPFFSAYSNAGVPGVYWRAAN
ncbi:hypothetical protein JCM10207_006262 [Rhodosporidiobolus poonsookiae]